MVLPGPEIVREVADAVRWRAEERESRRTGSGSEPAPNGSPRSLARPRRLLPSTVRGGIAGAVAILNSMRPAAERQLLGRLGGTDPDLLGDIRAAMFGTDVAATCQAAGA